MSYPYDDYEIEVFEYEGGVQFVRQEEELETESDNDEEESHQEED